MQWIAVACAVLILLIVVISNSLTTKLIRSKRFLFEDSIGDEIEKGNVPLEWYEMLKPEEYTIRSSHGFPLYIQVLKQTKGSDRVVILLHGYKFNIAGSLKYARLFEELGFHIVMYDHTHCGKSGGDYTTMGYRETYDLELIVNFARKEFGDNVQIGLHGESMGASTALMYAASHSGLSFVIEDCGYSDLSEELRFQLHKRYRLPYYPFIPLASLFCKLRAGFSFEDISPIRELGRPSVNNLPILFIHGLDDDFTPSWMLEAMYKAKRGKKEKYLVEGAGHAMSFTCDPEEYKEVVAWFLEEHVAAPAAL